MADTAELLISNQNGIYTIRVIGRATFECAPPLRNLAKSLEQATFSAIKVDLVQCSGMDSTFMGILAMLGLRSKKINATMTIYNANDLNKNLLFGLGLKKLFIFETGTVDTGEQNSEWANQSPESQGNAKMVLEAHKTLMNVDEQNVKKFEKVVDLVQKDIDRMNNPE